MGQLLEKFQDLIRRRQAEQVLHIMANKQTAGEIVSVTDFTTKLDNLVRELNQTNLQPTLKIFKADKITNSETYNFMLDRTADDLTAAFEEANNIFEVQDAHNTLIKNVLLKNLRANIAELETKITIYEFLSKIDYGFDNVIYSTFQESKNINLSRNIAQASTFFKDPRSYQAFSINEDAEIDLVGEKLVLAKDNKQYHLCSNVALYHDSDVTQSKYNTDYFSIDNIIDNQDNTFWSKQYFSLNKLAYIDCKIVFNFEGTKQINLLEITTPSTQGGFSLYQIHYINDAGVLTLMSIPNEIIGTNYSLFFEPIVTNQIILTFRINNAIPVQFQMTKEYHETVDLFTKVLGWATPEYFDYYLFNPNTTTYDLSGWGYNIGFDNIKFGQTFFANKSIYISQPLSIKDGVQIGLKVSENRPISEDGFNGTFENTSTTYDNTDDIFYGGSIEYWIIRESLNINDSILATDVFPILPTGVSRINHERLLLTEKQSTSTYINDTGSTCFFSTIDNGEVCVFCNGVLMPESSWNDVSVTKTPNSGLPMRLKIQIINPTLGNIYTVSYNPLVSTSLNIPVTLSEYSTTGLNIVDLIGNLSAQTIQDNLILLNDINLSEPIVKTNFYFVIILRNNTNNIMLTPSVEEYMVLLGTKDITKFQEI